MNKNNLNKKNKGKSNNGSTYINNDKKKEKYFKKNSIPQGVIPYDSEENINDNNFYLSNNLNSLDRLF